MIARFYRVIQFLSIDIVIGALAMLHFFSNLLDYPIDWHIYLLLALAVWIIYTLDHINDSRKALQPLRDRYLFHQKHKKVLRFLVVVAMILGLFFAQYADRFLLIGGALLGLISLSFLLFQKLFSKILIKEFVVALTYTLGIFLPFLCSTSFNFIPLILLLILSFTNLCLFSWYDRIEDEKDGFNSIAILLGDSRINKFMLVLIATGLSLSLLTLAESYFYWFFISSFILYLLIFLNPKFFSQNERYRVVGDGVFIFSFAFTL